MLGVIAERRFFYGEALALYEKSLTLDQVYEPARAAAVRVGGILSDLERFRKARSRVSRELLLVLVGAGVAVLLALRLTGRLRSAEM